MPENMLTNADIAELIDLRRDLHRHPEISGDEARTAATIAALMQDLGADRVETGIGGHGVVARFDSGRPGPQVMFRAELDALPIAERAGPDHASAVPGRGHLCGHDGHMAVLVGLARVLARRPPQTGAALLLFQPAEENGAGAAAMIGDPRFARLSPDWGFAFHNLPGLVQGRATIRAGAVNCASVGMLARFHGATSHASEPEKARSPARTLARLIPVLQSLARGTERDDDFRLVTITHLRMGEPAFGITPGDAELWVTLRALNDEGMEELRNAAIGRITDAAILDGLTVQMKWHDDFAASVNDAQAAQILSGAAAAAGYDVVDEALPMRASEDFGRFGSVARTAMIFLGAGTDHPPLHAENYDFPDDLIAPAVTMFDILLRRLTG